MQSPTRIKAIFEGGVFKPIDHVDLPDASEVELTIVDRRTFNAWWRGRANDRARRFGIEIRLRCDGPGTPNGGR